MFGADTDADQASCDMPQSGQVNHCLELPWCSCRPGVCEYCLKQLVGIDLYELRQASGEFATLLDLRQHSFRHSSGAQGIGQQIGRCHRILDGEINPDSARGRHGMGGIADTEQTGTMPLPQPIDLYR